MSATPRPPAIPRAPNSAGRMHADEVEVDASLVQRLLAAQFPQWAALPLVPVDSAGTDNIIYRLGGAMAVRLPRHERATGQVDREHRWLPKLAPLLPLPIPLPLALGSPGDGYPWHWSIYRWLDGETWSEGHINDLAAAAADLAQFIAALQRVDTEGGLQSVAAGSTLTLSGRDSLVRAAIAAVDGEFDSTAMAAVWGTALSAPAWDGPPVWVHGDLARPGNLLTVDGRLAAVLDFGTLSITDPARELGCAWSLFTAESRQAFSAALPFDAATWQRARGWALTFVQAIPYYRDTNPAIVAEARHIIGQVLQDYQQGG